MRALYRCLQPGNSQAVTETQYDRPTQKATLRILPPHALYWHYGCDDYWHSHYQARVCISERGGPDQRRGVLFCSGLCVVAAVEILSGVLEKQQ